MRRSRGQKGGLWFTSMVGWTEVIVLSMVNVGVLWFELGENLEDKEPWLFK